MADLGKEADIAQDGVEMKSFDDYQTRLGDMMRGERATLSKSLLDVQRELRISAKYIAAIEDCDPSAFDTPGFISGYVRSYARYLGIDPEEAFASFCAESGYEVSHGMSERASGPKRAGQTPAQLGTGSDIFAASSTPFAPEPVPLFEQVELRAVGSVIVLAALITAIGFGGFSVFKQMQRVEVAPIEQAPEVFSPASNAAVSEDLANIAEVPQIEALDRLYRPQSLDLPVLVARDAPIATLDPSENGAFVAPDAGISVASAGPEGRADSAELPIPQVLETGNSALTMIAVRPSWVRVSAADGTVIFQGVMDPGDSWEAPLTEEPPTLRTGESGAIYFAMGDRFYGPVGPNGSVTSDLPLDIAGLQETYLPVEISSDEGLRRFAEADNQ